MSCPGVTQDCILTAVLRTLAEMGTASLVPVSPSWLLSTGAWRSPWNCSKLLARCAQPGHATPSLDANWGCPCLFALCRAHR